MTTQKKPNRRTNVTCDLCGKGMYRRRSTLAMNAGKYCSRACRNRAHPLPDGRNFPVMVGPENPAWKGGVTYFKKKGNYKNIRYRRAPEWARPMARADGYIMEHRLVMAQRVGRLLNRSEVVHHRDHDPANNHPANLELWPSNATHKSAEHGRLVTGAANRLYQMG